MKSLIHRVLILAVAALVVAVAGQMRAETIMPQYTFEGLNAGAILTGQDSWQRAYSGYGDINVYQLTSGYNPTKVAGMQASTVTTTNSALRPTPTLTFTSADTSVEYHYWVQATNASVWCGPSWSCNGTSVWNPAYWGLQYVNATTVKTYFRNGTKYGFGEAWGDANLKAGDWYELVGILDFSDASTGGKFTLKYKNLTAGDTDYTTDGTLQNKNLGEVPNGLGEYVFSGMNIQMSRAVVAEWTALVDNFSVGPVPEPGTLALLAGGLVGLLAYAWRKRK